MSDEATKVQAALKRGRLSVPVNPVADIRGLKPIESQPATLQAALRHLGREGEFPFSAGWSRDIELGTPTHDANAIAWRPHRSDVLYVNQASPFIPAAQQDPEVLPILASAILHENAHVHGASEPDAYRQQIDFLKQSKSPKARHAAQVFSSALSRNETR